MNGTIRKFKAAPLIVQLLTALDVWPTLTPKQRDIVSSCRRDRPEDCPYDGDLPTTSIPARYIVDPRLPGMPARTMESLQRKGIADDRGLLTDRGVYIGAVGRPAMMTVELKINGKTIGHMEVRRYLSTTYLADCRWDAGRHITHGFHERVEHDPDDTAWELVHKVLDQHFARGGRR